MNTPVGAIVSWRVPTVVDLALLRAGITAAGLDPQELAPDLKPPSLVARAAGYIARNTSGSDSRRLARPVTHMSRQITREDVVLDHLQYTAEAAIGFDDATFSLTCDDPTIALTLKETASTIATTRTAGDVTRIVQKIVEAAGSDLIPVREQGGAYFIPAGHNVIGQVDRLLTHIGGELSQFACTIGHGSDASIANVITDYLLKQINELKTSITELNETGIRSDVKSRRLSRVAELRERIGAYSTLIQAQGSKLTDALNVAEASLLAKLGTDMDEPTGATTDAEAA
jgi:hypothetical protein